VPGQLSRRPLDSPQAPERPQVQRVADHPAQPLPFSRPGGDMLALTVAVVGILGLVYVKRRRQRKAAAR
jgi:hypothetical protein